jgi:hypothetical protein
MGKRKKLNNLGRMINNRMAKYHMKIKVLKTYESGSFDYYDKNRLKPMSRLRTNMREISLENQNSVKLKIKDWFSDIERGYSLPKGIKR